MPLIHIERIGGLAGFGGGSSRLRGRGQVEQSVLPAAEQKAVEELFGSKNPGEAKPMPDRFHYRISRSTPAGTQTVEVPESLTPKTLIQSVKDELV